MALLGNSLIIKSELTPNQSIMNTSSASSPSKPRNLNGIEKYFHHKLKKQAEIEIELIQNKINLLQNLEDKAKKKIEVARKKAEEIQKAKSRNELKLKEKEILKQIRLKEEEELKKKNFEEKYKRNITKRKLEEAILREKKEYAKLVKRKRGEFDEMCKSYKEMIRKQKSQIKSSRITEVAQHKVKSETYATNFTTNLKQAYEEKIKQEKHAYLELINKKKELEKQEAMTIENYARTLSHKVETFKTLEDVAKVPLFNLGFRVT